MLRMSTNEVMRMSDLREGTDTLADIMLNGLVLTVFIVLKLSGAVTWGWRWVLSPVWIPIIHEMITDGLSGLIYGLCKKG